MHSLADPIVLFLLFASFGASAGNRDPTMPGRIDIDPEILKKLALKESSTEGELEKQPLILTAIFSSMARKVAVINGELVKEGDVVYGKNIIKITDSSVVFNDKDNGDKIIKFLPLVTIKKIKKIKKEQKDEDQKGRSK